MSNLIKTSALYECKVPYLVDLFKKYEYPFEILPNIKSEILRLIDEGIEGFTHYSENVLIGRNVKIANYVTINGPAIIGHNTEIRPGAYIRGNLITGEGCVLGNSSEFKNAILLNNVSAPHYNYVGDSILGNFAHIGAGVILSNLKTGGGNVVIHAEDDIETGLRKVGSFLGDRADIGSGSVLNPGTVVCKNSSVYPLSMVRGVIYENMIYKSPENIVKRLI